MVNAELLEAVQRSMEKDGSLQTIRAQLRRNVLQVMNSQAPVTSSLSSSFSTEKGKLMLNVVRDMLEKCGLRESLLVFDAETNSKRPADSETESLEKTLGLHAPNAPLLDLLLEARLAELRTPKKSSLDIDTKETKDAKDEAEFKSSPKHLSPIDKRPFPLSEVKTSLPEPRALLQPLTRVRSLSPKPSPTSEHKSQGGFDLEESLEESLGGGGESLEGSLDFDSLKRPAFPRGGGDFPPISAKPLGKGLLAPLPELKKRGELKPLEGERRPLLPVEEKVEEKPLPTEAKDEEVEVEESIEEIEESKAEIEREEEEEKGREESEKEEGEGKGVGEESEEEKREERGPEEDESLSEDSPPKPLSRIVRELPPSSAVAAGGRAQVQRLGGGSTTRARWEGVDYRDDEEEFTEREERPRGGGLLASLRNRAGAQGGGRGGAGGGGVSPLKEVEEEEVSGSFEESRVESSFRSNQEEEEDGKGESREEERNGEGGEEYEEEFDAEGEDGEMVIHHEDDEEEDAGSPPRPRNTVEEKKEERGMMFTSKPLPKDEGEGEDYEEEFEDEEPAQRPNPFSKGREEETSSIGEEIESLPEDMSIGGSDEESEGEDWKPTPRQSNTNQESTGMFRQRSGALPTVSSNANSNRGLNFDALHDLDDEEEAGGGGYMPSVGGKKGEGGLREESEEENSVASEDFSAGQNSQEEEFDIN